MVARRSKKRNDPLPKWAAKLAWTLRRDGESNTSIASKLRCHVDTVRNIFRHKRRTGEHRVPKPGTGKKDDKRWVFAGSHGAANLVALDHLRTDADAGDTYKETHAAYLHDGYRAAYSTMCRALEAKLDFTTKRVRALRACVRGCWLRGCWLRGCWLRGCWLRGCSRLHWTHPPAPTRARAGERDTDWRDRSRAGRRRERPLAQPQPPPLPAWAVRLRGRVGGQPQGAQPPRRGFQEGHARQVEALLLPPGQVVLGAWPVHDGRGLPQRLRRRGWLRLGTLPGGAGAEGGALAAPGLDSFPLL
jgi:hypothetical protein